MGLGGLEPPTSRLSGVRSCQLSYKPFIHVTNIIDHMFIFNAALAFLMQVVVPFSAKN